MSYYNEIKEKLIKSEIYDRAKDYSKDRHKVSIYFEIGKLLSEAGKEYGKNIIKQYSENLMKEVGKKYNERTLRKMRQFYDMFANEKWSTMWTKLCWSHYREVLSLKDIDEIKYYLNECENKNLTQRQLQYKIKSNEYRRIPIESRNKLNKNEILRPNDLIPNPIRIKNSNNYENISEKTLQRLILEDIASFLKELGNGFTFIDNEYVIKYCSNDRTISREYELM